MINPYRGGHDRLPGPGLQPNEKKKLWIFAILFVIVFASFLGTKIWETTGVTPQEEPTGPDPTLPADVAPRRDDSGRPLTTYQPHSTTERRELAEDNLRTRLNELAMAGDLRDDASPDSTAVLDYLLDAALYDPSVTNVSELDHRVLDEEKAAYDPGPLRGRFTSAFGEITAVPEPVPYAGKVESVKELFPVVFRSADGGFYHVLSSTPIERKVGDWIQAYGIFYRLVERKEEGKEPVKAFGLLATKKTKNAYPPITVEEIDPEWAKLVLEQDFDQASDTRERPFWLILNYVKNLGIDGYRKERSAGKIQFQEMGDMARPLARSPELYRFQHVAMDGRIVRPVPNYLQEDNPGKIRKFSNATLVQPTRYLVQLVTPIDWTDYGFAVGEDFVRVEGIFYKRWQYQPEGSTVAHEIPLVIVTDVIPYRQPESGTMRIVQYLMVGAAVLIIIAFLSFALRDAKARAAFRERVLEQKRQREQRKGGGDES